MFRVLGDLTQEGCVAKIADDLYVGGNSPIEVLNNWRRVVALLQKNSLRLSATKTIICPRKAIVLGWVWSNGTLQASPNKLATLSSVEPSSTVQGFCSFVRAYKVLSHVLPRFAELLDPLDQATATNYCWPSKPPNVHWETTGPSQCPASRCLMDSDQRLRQEYRYHSHTICTLK